LLYSRRWLLNPKWALLRRTYEYRRHASRKGQSLACRAAGQLVYELKCCMFFSCIVYLILFLRDHLFHPYISHLTPSESHLMRIPYYYHKQLILSPGQPHTNPIATQTRGYRVGAFPSACHLLISYFPSFDVFPQVSLAQRLYNVTSIPQPLTLLLRHTVIGRPTWDLLSVSKEQAAQLV
jgi:hypothetical protein